MPTLAALQETFCETMDPRPAPVSGASYDPTRTDFAQQWQNLELHKQRFPFEPSPIFSLLERLARDTGPTLIEPSIKVSAQAILPERCSLYYYDASTWPRVVPAIFSFFEKVQQLVGCTLDAAPFAYLLEQGFSIENCRCIGLGVDLRPQTNHSRIKFGFLLKDDTADIVEDVYRFAAKPQYLEPLFMRYTTLVGLDLQFDGTSRLKTYPGFPPHEYPAMRRDLRFGPATMRFIQPAPFCIVAVLEPVLPVHLLLRGATISRFIDHDVTRDLEPRASYIVSAAPREIDRHEIENFNLYYNKDSEGDSHV